MHLHTICRTTVVATLMLSLTGSGHAASEPYTIDPASSQLTITVGKAGALSFAAGHTHEVAGPIRGTLEFDRDEPAHSHVRVVIRAADLNVSGRGEPPGDVPKVQSAMASDKVLDVSQFPEIRLESTAIAVKARRANVLDLVVTAQLSLHGVTRQVTVPVHAVLSDGNVTATGEFPLKQTDYGIKPVSVGGVVAVKDALDIRFSIAAHR